MISLSIMVRYSAVKRFLSVSENVAGMVLIGPQNRLSSALSAISASICGNTFTISALGCTTP
jgi:hypothetical protein